MEAHLHYLKKKIYQASLFISAFCYHNYEPLFNNDDIILYSY